MYAASHSVRRRVVLYTTSLDLRDPVLFHSPSFILKTATTPYYYCGVNATGFSSRPFCATKRQQHEQTKSGIIPQQNAVRVDVKTLYDPRIHLPDKPDFNDPSLGYEVSTPLSDELIKLIALAGPITFAEYMKQALTHPDYGYYTASNKIAIDDDDDYDNEDTSKNMCIIGKRGDFTTAPEISQIFGESILIWFLHQISSSMELKNKVAFTWIEVGPGKGTLMADILEASLKSFPSFLMALCSGGGIHLVEASIPLRQLQKDAIRRAFDKASASSSFKLVLLDGSTDDSTAAAIEEENTNNSAPRTLFVQWHDILGTVPNTPNNGPQLVVAQEFIDALPVHSFQKTTGGVWRERLVDVDAIDVDELLERNSNTSSSTDSKTSIATEKEETVRANSPQQHHKKPRLRFLLAPKVTTALQLLMKTDEFGHIQGSARRIADDAVDGDILEVCPEGLSFVQDVASRIRHCGGAALLIDYGSGSGTGDSVRAFKRHEQVHVLSLPGQVDITADVDFLALSNTIHQIGSTNIKNDEQIVRAHGPVNQGHFLAAMGIVERVQQLIDDDRTSDEQATDLYHALERLLLPDQMGERYKVLAITNHADAPAGFQ